MSLILLGLFLCAIVAGGCVAIYFLIFRKKAQSKRAVILETLYHNRPSVNKIILMERLNIDITTLKGLLDVLLLKKLIKTTMSDVEITDFGRQYYETFIKDKTNPSV